MTWSLPARVSLVAGVVLLVLGLGLGLLIAQPFGLLGFIGLLLAFDGLR